MRKFVKILCILFGLIFLFIFSIRINESYFKSKFENTKLNTNIQSVKSDWGNPNDEFMYEEKDKYVLKYKKGILGWKIYIFLFDIEKNILVEKYIDD